MKKEFRRFTLYAIIIYLTCGIFNPAVAVTPPFGGNGTHFCGVIDGQLNKRHANQFPNRHYARTFAANLNVGEPRTVRMIYFLPNDRPYRAEVVQQMKDEIRTVQTFFADQMEAHGYGRRTFRLETDAQGEPIVHRVDGLHPDSYYLDDTTIVYDEMKAAFNYEVNVYLTVIDNSIDAIRLEGALAGGGGNRRAKAGGEAWVTAAFNSFVVAHELGHAFGLQHDFRDGAYIMSYGPSPIIDGLPSNRLSQCHADNLSVHPYFNRNIPVHAGEPPTFELLSPRQYPAGSRSVVVRLKANSSAGLHQVFLYPQQPNNRGSVKSCSIFSGEASATVEFDYDGVIPSAHDPLYSRSTSLLDPLVHPIYIEAVDINGDRASAMVGTHFEFVLFSEAFQPLTKISGDNLQGLPNTPLPVPFVVELRDLNGVFPRYEVWVTFTVTAGGGRLSVERVKTDHAGRAESTLTLGPSFGTNTVEVSAEGLTVTFNAVAVAPVDIPDVNLRAALNIAPNTPIAPAEIGTITRLDAPNANISDLTGLQRATNLTELYLGAEHLEGEGWLNSNSVSNLSPLAGLTKLTRLGLRDNNISDLSALAGLTNLTWLHLLGNRISDLSPLAGLTNLTWLHLLDNRILDLSPLAGLINLEMLFLRGNNISDISALGGLTNLTRLGLAHNNISDLSPLARLTNLATLGLRGNRISDLSPLAGLTNLAKVVLRRNPLSYQSINTHIPDLRSRGVEVEFDNRTHPALLKISGDNQNGASFVSLSQPFVVEAQDVNGSPLAGISVTFAVTAGGGTLNTTITRTDTNGKAQSTLILGPNLGANTVEVSAAGIEVSATFHAIADSELSPTIADVNNDGSVNVLDLILIASSLGQSGQNDADVNGDRTVSVLDLVLAAGMFEGAAAAPSTQPQVPETLTAVEVQGWLTGARSLEVRDPIMKRGIMVLEQLLVSLTPKETKLLANYPNPFNPETWIPYRLAEDAFVILTIYGSMSRVVRTLEVGHRVAAFYESRSKAIYWDGRNEFGEQVASGVYFYHLSAGDYSATRKMVILK